MYMFYTRPGCGLCEEAKHAIGLFQEDFPLEYKEINIEEDGLLHEKYMLMIPVLEKDGEVVLYGNIGYGELLEALVL